MSSRTSTVLQMLVLLDFCLLKNTKLQNETYISAIFGRS